MDIHDSPSEPGHDLTLMRRLKTLAEEIFHRHGIDFSTAVRGCGYSNVTWLAGGLALRLSTQPGRATLLRETQLAALLPAQVGYPAIIESGTSDGFDWCLSRQVRGENLGEVWPGLDWDQRLTAIRQLWEKVEAVHSVDALDVSRIASRESVFYPANMEAVYSRLNRLLRHKLVSERQVKQLQHALARFWEVLPTATFVLNHGDFTIENALYADGQVVSLMDFEYAVLAPDELDVNELVKFAFAPGDRIDPLPDPGDAGKEKLRQLVLELVRPMVQHRHSQELLLGYAIQVEAWMLEERLVHPETESGVDQETLYRILGSLADGTGGYLATVFAMIDR